MKVVAFSYEIGSFGKSVAMDLAQNAGLEFIPFREVYQLALNRNERFRQRQKAIAEGRGDIDTWEGHFFSDPSSTSLFESIALEMAAKGDVILIGAGMQAVLHPFEGILRVHLRAPLEVRVQRFSELNGITVGEANQTVKWWDQRRRSVLEFNAIFDKEGSEYCDLIVNTDRVTIPVASRLLQAAIKELPGPADPASWQKGLNELALAKRVECAVREKAAAMGLAPLEVRPSGSHPGSLNLTGFVHTSEDMQEALALARRAAEGWDVISQLKILKLHGDLVPPSYWKAADYKTNSSNDS